MALCPLPNDALGDVSLAFLSGWWMAMPAGVWGHEQCHKLRTWPIRRWWVWLVEPCQLRTERPHLLKACGVPSTFHSIFFPGSRVFCAFLLIARLARICFPRVEMFYSTSFSYSAVLGLSMRDSLCSFLLQGKPELKQELTSLPA